MNGYPTSRPCSVCGRRNNNQLEPRFGYVVCEDHQHVPPVEVGKLERNKR